MPKPATNVRLTRGSDPTTSLTVTWTRGANNAASVTYRVRLDTNGVSGTALAASGPQTHSFSSLVPGQRYLAVVLAVAADGATITGQASSSIYTGM